MAKNRMRKLARKIACQPRLKKMLANFVVSHEMTYNKWEKDDMKEIRLNGHRGLLAMSENDLTKKFDVAYEELLVVQKKLEERINNYIGWGVAKIEDDLKMVKEEVKQAETIYDEIFEQVFL